jgi:two-component system OmpR family response regulator
VLIVEDDSRIVDFMRRGLRASGYEVDATDTAHAALGRLVAHQVDVLILDLGLPDMDGLSLLGELEARDASVPTIIVTAKSDPRYREEAIRMGVRAFITKPFAWADLLAAVRDAAGPARVPGAQRTD